MEGGLTSPSPCLASPPWRCSVLRNVDSNWTWSSPFLGHRAHLGAEPTTALTPLRLRNNKSSCDVGMSQGLWHHFCTVEIKVWKVCRTCFITALSRSPTVSVTHHRGMMVPHQAKTRSRPCIATQDCPEIWPAIQMPMCSLAQLWLCNFPFNSLAPTLDK